MGKYNIHDFPKDINISKWSKLASYKNRKAGSEFGLPGP